ncbi:hypothetical protein Dimus_017058 [Dionaea muscipula]
MGSNSSRSAASNSAPTPTPPAPPPPPPPPPPTFADVSSSDLSSYLAAVQFDQDLRDFDSALHGRTSRVINSLADGSLSVGTLSEVTGSLIDVNQEVVRVILECKKDIWDNKDLLSLVNEYFEYSIQTLDFFAALDRCLKRASDRQLILRVALLQYEEETRGLSTEGNAGGGDKSSWYAKTLQELRNFKEAGDPFTEEFFSLFSTVYRQQVQMFEKLNVKKRRFDKKLKRVRVYRKVSNFIFAATFIGVIICSAVAAAISAPHLLLALAASVASAPLLPTVGTWFDRLWKKYEDDLKGQRDLIGAMHIGTYIAVKDLDGIRVLVDRLEVYIESLLSNADLALNHGDAVGLVIEEIKKKVDVYTEEMEELMNHAEKYSRDVRKARTVILQKIIKYPATR